MKSLNYAGIGALTLAVLTPSVGYAEMEPNSAAASAGSHSLVHKVSHSLAAATTYTSGNAGYKWDKGVQVNESSANQWADAGTPRGGYKWGNSSIQDQPEVQSYAGASSYQWGTMSFSEQSGYKWAIKNFAEQSGYKWAIKSFAEQSGYKWAIKNFAEQSGYKWAINNFAEQSGYKWAINNAPTQSGYKWAIN